MKSMAEIVSLTLLPLGDCVIRLLCYSGRRLFEEDNPLVISLEASVSNRNSKLILRDNTYSTIQWDAFTPPELNNFILILRREEELYMEKVGQGELCGSGRGRGILVLHSFFYDQ